MDAFGGARGGGPTCRGPPSLTGFPRRRKVPPESPGGIPGSPGQSLGLQPRLSRSQSSSARAARRSRHAPMPRDDSERGRAEMHLAFTSLSVVEGGGDPLTSLAHHHWKELGKNATEASVIEKASILMGKGTEIIGQPRAEEREERRLQSVVEQSEQMATPSTPADESSEQAKERRAKATKKSEANKRRAEDAERYFRTRKDVQRGITPEEIDALRAEEIIRDKAAQIQRIGSLVGQHTVNFMSSFLNREHTKTEDLSAERKEKARLEKFEVEEKEKYQRALRIRRQAKMTVSQRAKLMKMENLPPDLSARTEEHFKMVEEVMVWINCRFYEGFNQQMQRELCKVMMLETIPPRTVLIRQGDEGQSLYIVLFGELEVRVRVMKEKKYSTSGSHGQNSGSSRRRAPSRRGKLHCGFAETAYHAKSEDCVAYLDVMPCFKAVNVDLLRKLAELFMPWANNKGDKLEVNGRTVLPIKIGQYCGEGAVWPELKRGLILHVVEELVYFVIEARQFHQLCPPAVIEALKRDAKMRVAMRDESRQSQLHAAARLQIRRPSLRNYISPVTGLRREEINQFKLPDEEPPVNLLVPLNKEASAPRDSVLERDHSTDSLPTAD
ncbi:hypothetical protein CYMTET_54922 [Cymbomonas tetramitiformis]|uniref:Cyclic nucleotide-binding domain-containing protein n=1 Tax=Cymbomonas tetramitiformis TaxID=36881 RepID=A0AAE0BF53_9CHLO|nr:hypothetical protein CYMTET_54922 [Cymbomonas tetramitiformis]